MSSAMNFADDALVLKGRLPDCGVHKWRLPEDEGVQLCRCPRILLHGPIADRPKEAQPLHQASKQRVRIQYLISSLYIAYNAAIEMAQ